MSDRLSRLCVVVCAVLLAVSCRPASPAETAQPPVQPEREAQETQIAPPFTGETLLPGDHIIELRHDGRDRSYIVHVPEVIEYPAPVVVAIHGGGGTGAGFQDQNGLDAVADREGFLAVYPEGSGLLPNRLHTWNSGDTCCGFALDRDVDDVGFLRLVVKDLTSNAAADPTRMYMTGHSNGAMMAYRFAAEAADMVTAIAPVGGAVDLDSLSPSESVPVLHIHSVDDPRALYDGGEGPPFPGTDRTVNHEPVFAGIERWAALNGCTGDVEVETTRQGTGENDGQAVELLAWSGCPAGATVEHLRLSGSGHGWPGVAVGRFWQERLGPPTTIINASETVWAFVSQFRG